MATAGEFRVLKLVFTSEVKNKEPVDKLTSVEAGQRVWVHLTMRNRGDLLRPVTVVFRVGGAARSRVDLKIEPSWSFRTWAYNTLRSGDTGALAVEVLDAEGAVLGSSEMPIRAAGSRP